MKDPMRNESSNATIPAPPASGETIPTPPDAPTAVVNQQDIPTRAKLRARQSFQQNRFVITGAGALAVALLVVVATSNTWKSPTQAMQTGTVASGQKLKQVANADRSLFPITDAERPLAKEVDQGFLNEKDLEHSASSSPQADSVRPERSEAPGTLGSIPPFGEDQPGWKASPYVAGTIPASNSEVDPANAEREAMEKSSLIYVRNVSENGVDHQAQDTITPRPPHIGLGLPPGTRLRARLESAASTAVRVPVLAAIEYTYERDGQVVIPAGAKAVGYIQEADRSGYLRIQFESLLMPDGATVPIQAAATDLDMRPLRGKVEGRNPGRNILVRSLSGIGQAGALLLGRDNLNGALSESDLIRERLSNNIGEASSEEVSRMAITSRTVVTVSAGTPIYVVLEMPESSVSLGQAENRSSQGLATNTEELRQLLRLKRELNESSSSSQ